MGNHIYTPSDGDRLTSNMTGNGPGGSGPVGQSSIAPYASVPVPPLDRSVPDRLRKAYNEAPTLGDRDLVSRGLVHAAHLARAERAEAAAQAAYAADHDGRTLFTDEHPARDAVLADGYTPDDFDDAQHTQRLQTAERVVRAAEAAAKAEADRKAARCRACGVLDVPTRQPVLTLPAPPAGAAGPSAPVVVVKLDGVLCAPCELVAVAEYTAGLTAERVGKLGKRRTRADLVRDYLEHTHHA